LARRRPSPAAPAAAHADSTSDGSGTGVQRSATPGPDRGRLVVKAPNGARAALLIWNANQPVVTVHHLPAEQRHKGVGVTSTLTVFDAYDNVARSYRGKVQLSCSDPKQGTRDDTFTKSDNGVHVFSFTFNTLGSQTLYLTDTTNSSIVGSAVVNVVPKTCFSAGIGLPGANHCPWRRGRRWRIDVIRRRTRLRRDANIRD
jgi:hypothetical protein